MSSFGYLSRMRKGYWVAFRKFILNEKKDISRRISVINAELDRIGKIKVTYQKRTDPTTKRTVVTENRTGFFVSEDSSLGKLVQAYIALGGNPFDISYFFYPDLTVVENNGDQKEVYPYGGVVAPESKSYNDPVGTFFPHSGGFPRIKKYIGNRYGDRLTPSNLTEDNLSLMTHMRSLVSQEVKEKIHELEHRIIKLADLREQLEQEKEELFEQMVGGTLYATPEFDTEKFSENLRLQRVIRTIDESFFTKDRTGKIQNFSIDPQKIASYESYYNDQPEEIYLSYMA